MYRIAAVVPWGGFVHLHYLPWFTKGTWNNVRFRAPYFRVSAARWAEIQASSPGRPDRTPFRILEEREHDVVLEWVTT